MTEAQEKGRVHHGQNLKTGRVMKGFSQEELAAQMGIMQSELSKLERKAVIDKKILEKAAQVLGININFLETFVPDDIMGVYTHNTDSVGTQNTNTISDGGTENETNIMGGGNDYQNIINNNSIPFSEFKELLNQLREQDKQLADMRVLLAKHGIDTP